MWMRKKKAATTRPAARRRAPTSLGALWRRVVGPARGGKTKKTKTKKSKSKIGSLSRAFRVFSCVRGHGKGRMAARAARRY
ncbi:hypothetical protein D1007_01962 [Hordeum vulgare]|uniref:Predicted protein n=1 Tax=Hordeum vulgare subsp. vulgare TaxID=112509 RepID=F2E5F5_HORVV|nr:uncharacterized protein LOC123446161 [Hordeum vulgare subsp. vulgare]KAE8820242.1 hypothetical protein D1007_01962 [Hordeum vulgare]BAK02577.1 predicted protein [Hordeum vulgare subsp. vulgare]